MPDRRSQGSREQGRDPFRDEIARDLADAKKTNPSKKIPKGHAAHAAALLGVSAKTVRRDVNRLLKEAEAPAPALQAEMDSDFRQYLLDQYALAGANASAAFRRLVGYTKVYSTYRQFINDELPAATRQDIAGGDRARLEAELHILRTYRQPGDVEIADEKSVSIEIRHPTTETPSSPTICHVRDGYSGAVLGASGTPDASFDHNHFLRALGDAFDPDSDVFPRGGRPMALQWDQATWHTADEVTEIISSKHIPIVVIDGYNPQQDGAIEAFHNFVELDYAKPNPFYLHGRKTLDNRRIGPSHDALPSWEEFWSDYRAWLRKYNFEWKQRLRGNKTPLQIWDDADSHPEPLDPTFIEELLAR